MSGEDNAFFGLKVPEGNDRRELYKSQYRAIYTYKMSASELDEAFRTAVTTCQASRHTNLSERRSSMDHLDASCESCSPHGTGKVHVISSASRASPLDEAWV